MDLGYLDVLLVGKVPTVDGNLVAAAKRLPGQRGQKGKWGPELAARQKWDVLIGQSSLEG